MTFRGVSRGLRGLWPREKGGALDELGDFCGVCGRDVSRERAYARGDGLGVETVLCRGCMALEAPDLLAALDGMVATCPECQGALGLMPRAVRRRHDRALRRVH
jgi:hypothetical protein